ncbi:MAG: hypothetical protein KDD47_00785 [Acidobacteria bacterium]|nr:hypothetical protein [Acidobacteriota bacterium]
MAGLRRSWGGRIWAVSHIGGLRKLHLRQNQLTSLPSTIGDLSQLEILDLLGNELAGPIPSTLGQLSQLVFLHLGLNRFTSVPPEIGDLDAAVEVYLDGNLLTSLPQEIGDLAAVEILWIGQNEITGPFPMQLLNLSTLHQLVLDDNHFSGPLPVELATVGGPDFSFLSLGDNDFSGTIPPELAQLDAGISLVNNDLVGEVPLEFASGPPNMRLRIHWNCVTATEPALVGKLNLWNPGWQSTQCTKVFDDDFATGDLSRWSSFEGTLADP